MSLAPILAARGVESFPGTCKIDISAKIEGCGAGVEIIIGGGNYHVEPKPDYIYITPTKPGEGDGGVPPVVKPPVVKPPVVKPPTIYDCAGVSLKRGVEVDNCLFIADKKILDLDLNLGTDPSADSLLSGLLG
ncbi:hypothetical protein VdG1_06777 [Verticillium dahliae VDG1]|nr:hypothetical protein VdG1_06777 [Verticillium dahliae VDG1]